MISQKRLMISCPDLSKAGGVANYYRILRKELIDDSRFDFFEAGGSSRSPIGVLFALFSETFSYIFALKKGNYSCVLVNPSLLPRAILRNAAFVLIAKMLGKKVIVFWRGFNLHVEKRIEHSFRRMFSFAFNRADLSIVLAQEFKDKLRELRITHPVIVSTTVIDLTKMPLVNPGIHNFVKKKLLFLSRIEKNKGIYEALEAFRILRQSDPDVSMDVVGDGPDLLNIQEQYRDLCGVTYHGYLHDQEKMHVLERASVFVFPSYTEGMPNCVLEAMACGLPVVTTAVGGLKDFFVDGENGYFVEQQNPQQLAGRIASLFSNAETHGMISSRNFNFARAHFSSGQAAEFIRSIYEAAVTDSEQELPAFWYSSVSRQSNDIYSCSPKELNTHVGDQPRRDA